MSRISFLAALALLAAAILATQPALAETPAQVLASIQNTAKASSVSQPFSAARGEQFFKNTHGNDWSCASCHTGNPAALGKHAKTAKPIEPLAPAANPQRFTEPAKVAKWFKRNCGDVLGRACTPQEQGDVLSYLLTVKK